MRGTCVLLVAVLAWLLVLCSVPTEAVSLISDGITFKESEQFYVGAEPYRALSVLVRYSIRSLPLLALKDDKRKAAEKTFANNLGLRLLGSRAVPTIFSFQPLFTHTLKKAQEVQLSTKEAARLLRMCQNGYAGSFNLNGLSGVFETATAENLLRSTYAIGWMRNQGICYVTNAFNFVFYYQVSNGEENTHYYTVVGFKVTPLLKNNVTVDASAIKAKQSATVGMYYAAEWVEDADGSHMTQLRESAFAKEEDLRRRRGHFISSLNVFLLWTLVGVTATTVLFRTVRRDLLDETDPEQLEELRSGGKWKLVQGDVFRTPPHPVLFASLVGAGVQLCSMVVFTFVCSAIGLLHPSQRGVLLTGFVFTYIFSSSICGFVVARLLKLFKVQSNIRALIASLVLPFMIMVVYVVLNGIQLFKHTSMSSPFSATVLLLVLEFFCAIPLVFIGIVVGYRMREISVPCKVSALPRLMPSDVSHGIDAFDLFSGFLPFLASFIEMTYVLNSMWQSSAFYRPNTLFGQALVILSLCAEVSIIVTYITLSQQNYMWWWRSFSCVAWCGVYMFIYSIYYMLNVLQVRQPLSIFIFCGYMGGFCTLVALVTGSVGFISSFVFVRVIYTASKAE
ncbi:endosomal integral membrane protein [Strigomonas culicis]|uniref:Transmembrane 9 superfamily member n=1 Tax=Strigomonas culicis TaxID=28005 RepID=S9TTZ6_9TRYP|nr:endosomal integral membrane protein [Strigomonas culicis]|eukprot:EPY21892.1 endosomal integral membrane protein [Strigomonas culicis]